MFYFLFFCFIFINFLWVTWHFQNAILIYPYCFSMYFPIYWFFSNCLFIIYMLLPSDFSGFWWETHCHLNCLSPVWGKLILPFWLLLKLFLYLSFSENCLWFILMWISLILFCLEFAQLWICKFIYFSILGKFSAIIFKYFFQYYSLFSSPSGILFI